MGIGSSSSSDQFNGDGVEDRPLEVLRLFLTPGCSQEEPKVGDGEGDGNVAAGLSSFTGDAWESEDELSDNWATNSSSEESTAEESESESPIMSAKSVGATCLGWRLREKNIPVGMDTEGESSSSSIVTSNAKLKRCCEMPSCRRFCVYVISTLQNSWTCGFSSVRNSVFMT